MVEIIRGNKNWYMFLLFEDLEIMVEEVQGTFRILGEHCSHFLIFFFLVFHSHISYFP